MIRLTLPDYDPNLWFECNAPLLEIARRPVDVGFATAGELLAHVARQRALNIRALTKQLEAVRFLQTTYPQLVASGRVAGGYSQTEYLKKIHELSPERADQLAARVVNGEISMATMRDEYNSALEASGRPGSTGAMARHRAVAFEHACRKVIEDRIEEFSGQSEAKLTPSYKLDGHTIDYAVHDDRLIYSAIECSSGGMRSTPREAFGMVSTLAMLKRKAQHVWLLLPESAAPFADAVLEMNAEWGLADVNVGLVSEGPEPTMSTRLKPPAKASSD
jgi:hypothetical protein